MGSKSGKFGERGKVIFHSNDDSLQKYTYELLEEISLLNKEKAVLLSAIETGGDYEISGMAKVDFVLLRDSLRDALEKLKEIRE